MDVFYFKIKSENKEVGDFMKIKVVNKSIDQKIFDNFKDKVYDMVFDISKKLNIDSDIIVNVCGNGTEKGVNGSCYSMKNRHIIYLYQHLFEREDDSLELVILHELVHAKDAYLINKKKDNFKTYKTYKKDIDNYIIKTGFDTWTEFHAHFIVNKISNDYKFSYTTLKMVKKYEEILSIKDKIIQTIKNKKDYNELLSEYFKKTDEYIYMFSTTLAAMPFKNYNYEYVEKTQNKPAFKKVMKLYDKAYKLIGKMFHGTYGKHMEKRLFNIGYFIFDEFYYPLNIGIKKYRRGLDLCFFMERESENNV